MASQYLKKFPVPENFPEILHDFARKVLKDQPGDVLDFAHEYFKAKDEGLDFEYEGKSDPLPQKVTVAQTLPSKDAQEAITKKVDKQEESPTDKSNKKTKDDQKDEPTKEANGDIKKDLPKRDTHEEAKIQKPKLTAAAGKESPGNH